MGWRISFYGVKKGGEFLDKEGDVRDEAEELLYDKATSVWLDLRVENEEFKKEVTCVKEDEDRDLYKITKKALSMIILETIERQISYLKGIDEKGKSDKNNERKQQLYRNVKTPEEYVKDQIYYWSSIYDKGEEPYGFNFDARINSKEISGSWTWAGEIMDLCYLMKTFDWKNNELYVIGR